MGILDKIKGQLIDVIEWSDSSANTMVHKYDMNGKEIMNGDHEQPADPDCAEKLEIWI